MNDIKSAVRETLRTTILAVIPLTILQIESGVYDWRAVAIAFAIGLLRGGEKYLHDTQPKNMVSQVLQFKNIK